MIALSDTSKRKIVLRDDYHGYTINICIQKQIYIQSSVDLLFTHKPYFDPEFIQSAALLKV